MEKRMIMYKRIKYFDLLRIISSLFIVWYHMLVNLEISGICESGSKAKYYENINMNIASLAVACFFMLSGACLSGGGEKFSCKKFYLSRLKKILIPFYIVVALTWMERVILNSFNIKSVMAPYTGVEAWKIIFTLLGLDGWILQYNISSFATVGEWFLGCIILMYLVYPVLRKFMVFNIRAFFIAFTCFYIVVIYNYNSSIAIYMNIFVKLYEFVIGMIIGYAGSEFDKKYSVIAIPAAVFFFTSTTALNINLDLKITLSALSVFASLSYLEPLLNKINLKSLKILSNYTYILFLVHHEIIYRMAPLCKIFINTKLFLIVELITIMACTFIVKQMVDIANKKILFT